LPYALFRAKLLRMIKRTLPLLIPLLLITLSFLLIACQAAPAADIVEVTTAQAEPVEAESAPAEETEADSDEVEHEQADTEKAEHEEAGSDETEHEDAEGEEAEQEDVDSEDSESANAVEEGQEERTWDTLEMRIPGADDQLIAATFTAPVEGEPVPAVLLLHMLGSHQGAWSESELLTQLHDSGYATMTIDMRGHGATGGINDWDKAQTDHLRVWQRLRDMPQVDGQATAVIGASIGANMALRLGADVPQIDTVVLLSPGLEYQGVTTDDALVNYGERPLFYAAATGDSYADGSVTALAAQSTGPKQVEKLEGNAHGTQMLTAEPALSEQITAWLDEHVATGDPEIAAVDSGQVVNIQRPDFVELNGTLYGDGPQAVVLANMNDNISDQWTETARMLADEGYMVLTFDYRAGGNGFIDERDDDLLAALQFVADQGAQEIVAAGASIGGAAVLKPSAAQPDH